MSTYNMRKRPPRKSETVRRLELTEKQLVERRQLARDKYRSGGVSIARVAVLLAEAGYGAEYIARHTGVDPSFARLVVAGTD